MVVRRGSRNSKRKKASASAAGDCSLKRKEETATKGCVILEKKKEMEAMMATRYLSRTKPTAEQGQPAGTKKKRNRVVKTRLSKAHIEEMIASPYKMVDEISADELSKRPKYFREFYQNCESVAAKIEAYQQALIKQYKELGYAEDETEVTDDDEEMMEN